MINIFGFLVLIGAALLMGPGLSTPNQGETSPAVLNPQAKPAVIQTGEIQKAKVAADFGRLPLYFIANRGQVDQRVKFYAQSGAQTTWFTQEGVVVSLSEPLAQPGIVKGKQRPGPGAREKRPEIKTTTVGLSPVGLRKGVKIAALEPQEHKVNYFIGNNPKKWRTDVPTYRAVAYQGAYKGIDLKFYGDGRQFEYDIIVKPGSDPNQVKFQYAGIQGLEVTPTGDLAINLPDGGVLVQKKPYVYQEVAGTRVAREGKFKLHGAVAGHTYGFEVAAYDRKIPLIIDPVLVYSTYLGGSGLDTGQTIQVDGAGCAYVAGATYSKLSDPVPFPRVNPLTPQYGPNMWNCVFVSKFNAQGNGLLYSTYLGGNPSNDYYAAPPYGRIGLAVDAGGSAYITGWTYTTNFPTTLGAPYRTIWSDPLKSPGSAEAFVTKLAAAGNSLAYSTYMRGDNNDYAHAIVLDSQGNAYIGGYTESGSYVAGSNNSLNGTILPNYYSGSGAPFITKLNPSGSAFLWTRGLVVNDPNGVGYGGSWTGVAAMVAETSFAGGVWVTGDTLDEHFPVVRPLQASLVGQINAFVTWVDRNGAIRFSTFWGGGTGPVGDYTAGYGIARGPNPNGDIYVCGYTNNAAFPISPNTSFPKSATAYQRTYGGGDEDAFLLRITNPSYTKPTLVYSSYLGGDYTDYAQAVAVDQNGNAYITGGTNSNNFPLQNALYTTAGNNIFVAQMGYDGARMTLGYSTFIGASAGWLDGGNGTGITHDGNSSAYLTGGTSGGLSFPLVNPYQNTLRGASDAFVLKLSAALLPAPPPSRPRRPMPWLPVLLR